MGVSLHRKTLRSWVFLEYCPFRVTFPMYLCKVIQDALVGVVVISAFLFLLVIMDFLPFIPAKKGPAQNPLLHVPCSVSPPFHPSPWGEITAHPEPTPVSDTTLGHSGSEDPTHMAPSPLPEPAWAPSLDCPLQGRAWACRAGPLGGWGQLSAELWSERGCAGSSWYDMVPGWQDWGEGIISASPHLPAQMSEDFATSRCGPYLLCCAKGIFLKVGGEKIFYWRVC